MTTRYRTLGLAFLALASTALAEPPAPPRHPDAPAPETTIGAGARQVDIVLKDGTRLAADLYLPDACVPISRLAEAITAARAAAASAGLAAPIVGHVGDVNFHMLLLHDPADPEELRRAEALSGEIADLSIRMGGTATGEHGIGLHKLGAMRSEHGEAALALMSRIKQALDPHNVLN